MSKQGVKDEQQLAGVVNFSAWEKVVKPVMAKHGLTKIFTKECSVFVTKINEDNPLSATPTTAERTKRQAALQELEDKYKEAFSCLWESLTKTIQDQLLGNLADFDWHTPQRSCASGSRRSTAPIGASASPSSGHVSGQPPQPRTRTPSPGLIRAALAEIVSAASGLSLQQFANSIGAYAGLRSLPMSYRMLVSTLCTSDNTVRLDGGVRQCM